MSSRLTAWVKSQNCSEYELACGLNNGEIECPEWLSTGYTAIGFAIWDNEESDGTTHLYDLDTTPPSEE
jgi:hypothetical protein